MRGANEARTVRLGNIVFSTAKATNVATITVPAARRNAFFDAFHEQNVIDEKHADELPARVAREQERARLDMLERERLAQAQG